MRRYFLEALEHGSYAKYIIIKLLIATACLFVAGLCLARLAHLIFFHRLMAAKKWLRYSLLAVATSAIVGSLVIICSFVFACRPVSKAWDISLSGSCIDQTAIFVALAVLNILSDIGLFILPISVILDLHISRAQKIKLTIFVLLICGSVYKHIHAFSLSSTDNLLHGSTFVASAIRLRLTVPLLGSNDLTYRMTPVALLVYVH